MGQYVDSTNNIIYNNVSKGIGFRHNDYQHNW